MLLYGLFSDVIGLLTEVCDLDFKEKGNEKLLILMNRDTEQVRVYTYSIINTLHIVLIINFLF
jgi:hypothetical protein